MQSQPGDRHQEPNGQCQSLVCVEGMCSSSNDTDHTRTQRDCLCKQQIKTKEESHAAGKILNTSTVRHVAGSVASQTDKGDVRTHSKNYKLGEIIRIPHVAPSLDPEAMHRDAHVGWVENTGPVIGKLRPAVIVSIYQDSLTCIPVFTSGGKGFHRKRAGNCMWLRQWTCYGNCWRTRKETEYLVVQSPYQPKKQSYIDLTQASPVSFKCPIARLGRLTPDSSNRLREMWLITVDRGFQPVEKQHEYAKLKMGSIVPTNDFQKLHREELDKRQGWRKRLRGRKRWLQ